MGSRRRSGGVPGTRAAAPLTRFGVAGRWNVGSDLHPHRVVGFLRRRPPPPHCQHAVSRSGLPPAALTAGIVFMGYPFFRPSRGFLLSWTVNQPRGPFQGQDLSRTQYGRPPTGARPAPCRRSNVRDAAPGAKHPGPRARCFCGRPSNIPSTKRCIARETNTSMPTRPLIAGRSNKSDEHKPGPRFSVPRGRKEQLQPGYKTHLWQMEQLSDLCRIKDPMRSPRHPPSGVSSLELCPGRTTPDLKFLVGGMNSKGCGGRDGVKPLDFRSFRQAVVF